MPNFNKTHFLPKNTHSQFLDLFKFYPPKFPYFSTTESLSLTSKDFFNTMELFSKFTPTTFPTCPLLITSFFPSVFILYPGDFVKCCLQNFPHLSTTEFLILPPKYSFCPLQIASTFTPTFSFLYNIDYIFSTPKMCILSLKYHLSFSLKIAPEINSDLAPKLPFSYTNSSCGPSQFPQAFS